MRHIDKSDAQLAVQHLQFHLHLFTQFEIQRTQRFIQQQNAWLIHQRTRQRHTLTLPT